MNKRFTSLMTTLILSVFFSISSFAYDVEVDGIYYNINKKIKTAEVTKGNDYYRGDIIIPEKIVVDNEVYNVTRIGGEPFSGGAFYGCSGLTSVTIPNSVTSIGALAFDDCSSLKSITIPNSVTIIEEFAFAFSGITSITIPNSVMDIDVSAFFKCSDLTTVTLPNSITCINPGLFHYCENLTSITIPDSVTSIGSTAFLGCSNLASIIIPNSVKTIGFEAFESCHSLVSISIPNSVIKIEDGVFNDCTNLETISIENSVVTIERGAFANCKNLMSVFCYGEKVPTTSKDAFKNSYIEYATLYVPESSINIYQTTEPWNGFGTIKSIEGSGMKTVKSRGIAIQSAGGFVTISGLDNNETVSFYGMDGKSLGSATAINGTTSFAAQSGSILVAKIGKESIKIAVK